MNPTTHVPQLRAARGICVAAAVALAGCQQGGPYVTPAVLDGDARRGAMAIERFGCGSCHTIPGVRGATARVGPPLTHWAERTYIAGNLVNEPDNLVRWIMFPDSVEPGTAMPTLGIDEGSARDIAAYLYTVGNVSRLGPPHPFPIQWIHDRMPMHARQPH